MLAVALTALAAVAAPSDYLASVGDAPSDHWAVLVAGSSSFANYRHQSDVCHAYQIVRKRGIPPAQIIVMAANDIASSSQNPFPGQIFNKPTAAGVSGFDVYKGCEIDWEGRDVTPANFMKVLTGDDSVGVEKINTMAPETGCNTTTCSAPTTCCCEKEGLFHFSCKEWTCCASDMTCHKGTGCVPPPPPPPRKYLKSTNTSRVFVNFVDHGGVGIIAFPDGSTLTSQELIQTLTTMHSKGMYKELVFYLEACESGSMFQGLPTNLNIFATTAANAGESSWGTYCSPDDKVDGKSIGSCLGDLYSVNWMENSDNSTSGVETLEEQYKIVKTLTNKSHVLQFGDTSGVGMEPIESFQGDGSIEASRSASRSRSHDNSASARPPSSDLDSREIEMEYAYKRFIATESMDDAAALIAKIHDRAEATARFMALWRLVAGPETPLETYATPSTYDQHCHHKAVKGYEARCGQLSTEALKHAATLAKLCHLESGRSTRIVEAIGNVCHAP